MAKKTNLTMTPVMSLAVFALFVMMIPLFSLANNSSRATVSNAAQATPSPTPYEMMEK